MKKLLTVLFTILMLSGCISNEKDESNNNTVDTKIESINVEDIFLQNKSEIETYLMLNDYYNLVFDSIENKDGNSFICKYHSYLPTSVSKCIDTLVSIECSYDETKKDIVYKNINTNIIETIKQPSKKVYLNMYNIGLNCIEVPFSWNLEIITDNFNSQLFNYNHEDADITHFEEPKFYFWNDEVLDINYRTSVDPFNPEFTKEMNTGNYKLTFNSMIGLLENGNGYMIFKITDSIPYEERLELINTIKPVSNALEDDNQLSDTNINYTNSIFNIKLLYDMRIRSNRNQHDNIVEMTKEGTICPVYKVINDGKFIWYCIGENMWIGDDGTCIEKIS